MPINLYDKPANYEFVNTYVPYTDVAQMLYKTGASRQARADANRAQAKEAAQKAGDKLAWWDQYANEYNVRNIISNKLADVTKNVDPSTSDYTSKVSSILTDPQTSWFYAQSEANKKNADDWVKVPETDNYRKGTQWGQLKARQTLTNLNIASQKETFGGTDFIRKYYGETGLPAPNINEYKDLGQQFIDNAAKLDPSGYQIVNGEMYYKTEKGWEGVTKERIAQINGMQRDPKTGQWTMDENSYTTFLNTDAGKSTIDNAKYSAFGNDERIIGDPRFDDKINMALASDPNTPITFVDYETGAQYTEKAGNIKNRYAQAFNAELDAAIEKAYSIARSKTVNKTEMTDAAIADEFKKKKAAVPSTGIDLPGLAVDLNDMRTLYGLAAGQGVNTTGMQQQALDVVLKLQQQGLFRKDVDASKMSAESLISLADSLLKLGNNRSALPATTISSFDEAIDKYSGALDQQRQARETVLQGYENYSDQLTDVERKTNYDILAPVMTQIQKRGNPIKYDNADKYILALAEPEMYGTLAFSSAQEARDAYNKLPRYVREQIATQKYNLTNSMQTYYKDNPTSVTSGDKVFIPEEGTEEYNLRQELQKYFNSAEGLATFTAQYDIYGRSIDSQVNEETFKAIKKGNYEIVAYFSENPFKGKNGITYHLKLRDGASSTNADKFVELRNIEPTGNVNTKLHNSLIRQVQAAKQEYNDVRNPQNRQALNMTYERIGIGQSGVALENGFKTTSRGRDIPTQYGAKFKVISDENAATKGLNGYIMYVQDPLTLEYLKVSDDEIEKATGSTSIGDVNGIRQVVGYFYDQTQVVGTPYENMVDKKQTFDVQY